MRHTAVPGFQPLNSSALIHRPDGRVILCQPSALDRRALQAPAQCCGRKLCLGDRSLTSWLLAKQASPISIWGGMTQDSWFEFLLLEPNRSKIHAIHEERAKTQTDTHEDFLRASEWNDRDLGTRPSHDHPEP